MLFLSIWIKTHTLCIWYCYDMWYCLATVGVMRFLCDDFGCRTFYVLYLEEKEMKKTKKVLALVLSAILVFSVMPFCTFTITAISSDQVKNVIDQIKANEYKPGTTPPTGQYRSGTSGCFGFADLLCRKIFGHNLASQKSAMELNSTSNFLKVGSTLSRAAGNLNETTLFNLFSSALPGDIIQMDYTKYDGSDSRHTTVFYSANNNGVVFYHAGSSKVYFGANSGTQPLWGTNGSILTWANLLYCLRSSDDGISLYRSTTVVGGSNPQGCIDAISAGAGSVYVSGWAFDRDNLPESLQVNVYIGGELHQICANVSRTDVDAYYNVGEFHGFNTSISTSKTGWQEVAIYAINIGGGDHTYLGCSTVYITPADITPPTISNVVVSDVTSSGYTVTCTVTDNSGISSVSFPTWTEYNDQDDLFWREGTISGNTVTFRVNTSEHNNESGKYITHIYAYDIPGNCTSIAINANVPDSYVSSYYYNGHTYEVYDINMTWAEAKEYCENKSGGHLLTIEDAEEQAFINQILSERTIYAYAIGGTDAETEGVWKWVNGKTVSYTNWIEGQPDNCGNEDNMWIYADNASNYFGKWNDYPGTDWSIGFICEIEKYSIEYNLDGGSNSKDNPDSYTYDTPAISLKNPTKNGYVFKGWYSDSNFTKKVTKIDKDSSGNKTLYAKWEKKYIVNYKLSGGKNNSNNPKEYTVSSDITLKKPTREGMMLFS